MKLLDISKAVEGLALNELGGNFEIAYTLSWAGNANSGISFGVQQFDTKHNSAGFKILSKLGVSEEDLNNIKHFNRKPGKGAFTTLKQKGTVRRVTDILKKNKKYLRSLASNHVKDSLNWLVKTIKIDGMKFESMKTIMQLIDYHNQFYISLNGSMHKFLKENKDKTITSLMIKNYKLSHTKWGRSKIGKNDINRRFRNIEKVEYEIKINNSYDLNDELFE